MGRSRTALPWLRKVNTTNDGDLSTCSQWRETVVRLEGSLYQATELLDG